MDERQRKIEAGRSKLADFKRKRSRSAKLPPPNAVTSHASEKRSTVDPGGTSALKESPIHTIEQREPAVSSIEPTNNIETISSDDLPVMDSSPPSDNSDCQNQSLQESLSIESFTLDTIVDQTEASSSSDNSTITGFSSNSRSDSTTENEVFKKTFTPFTITMRDNVEVVSQSQLESKNDNRPDEEKALESIPTEEKEKDLLVEEIFISKESMLDAVLPVPNKYTLEDETQMKSFHNMISQDKASINEVAEEDKSHILENVNISLSSLLNLTEADDDSSAFLNADDTHFSSVVDHYQIKVKKYQEAIQKRDSVIHKLSKTLETMMNANQAAHSDGNSQVENLKEEINFLQLKMKETAELWKKQNLKNGNIELENCACQTDSLQKNQCDTAIQVETSFSSLLQSCDLNESSFFELFIKKFSTNSDSLHHVVQKLGELLTTHFSHVHVKELMTLLKDNLQHDLEITDSSSSTISDTQSPEKVETSTILKKINSLNMVAKLIESLISVSSGNISSIFSDYSPSKFQSFFLRRLNSMESGDILPDLSESESVVSDFNYAEVETSATKPMPIFEPVSPIERLRQKNLSEDFSVVTDFLQDEMDNLRNCLSSTFPGPQGDGLETPENVQEKDCVYEAGEAVIESNEQKISLQMSKLETRLKNLKLLDKELHNVQQFTHQLSIDSDTMTLSEDNIMMEELPLSCISLLSLTDSEYKGDNIPTDSETNFSRKVSLDMSRSMQEREFCIRCERNADLLKEKYENDIMNLKDELEKSYSAQKKSLLESLKKLKADVFDLKTDKDNLKLEFSRQIESLCSENTSKVKLLSEKYTEDMLQVKASQSKILLEKNELEVKYMEVYKKLAFSDQKLCETLDAKSENEINLQNQIADLIQEHEQDLEMMKFDNESKLNREEKQLEDNYKTLIEDMKKTHKEEINNFRHQIKKEFEEREQNLLSEHSKTISMIEAAHCDESAVYQKKIEQLLEEKCELLSKTTQEYETILNKNHRALEILCKQLMAKIKTEKERVLNESSRSVGADLDVSLSALEQLNNSLENGLLKFLNQNYFLSTNNEEFNLDETEYLDLPIEMRFAAGDGDMPPISKMKQSACISKKVDEKSGSRSSLESHGESRVAPSESSLDSDDLFTIHAEINRLQEEFEKDVAFYKSINDQLHVEINSLRQKNQELEEQKESLEVQLQEKVKELDAKESILTDIDAAAVKDGSQLSASDIKSWQVQAAQTNSRLLHVLSDLVKTFLDIEHDINAHLLEYGLVTSRSGILTHHDDDTGQSVGSREDFASLSLGECPNLELTEDGPDLTPRACDVFIPSGNYDADLEGEDVVLGASRRLRVAVDHLLSLLSKAVENQQSQDLKLLLKRNEELSHELQEESQGRDAVNMELVTAESTVRRLESEKLRLEDLNRDLKDDYDMLKRELHIERSKVSHLQQEKETALDEIHTLKEQCELLASRLGDPGKTENNKMLNPSGTCLHENSELLEENSRLSSEKQNVQKSLSKERQSFLDRLHHMEIALEELNAEKAEKLEEKCKEISDLKAEMEAMEKQLQSNRKFIEQQALEREQEREEFMNKITRMEEFVKEKERIQSSESQMAKEIESLEELLRARIEDHKNAMAKKDEVEKELRQSVDKVRDLREVIDELEKQLDAKSRIEMELRQKLSNVCELLPNQDKNGSHSDSGDSSKHSQANKESMEQLHNLKEQLASRSQEIEMMSQSQTLLQELRGQIHFLEAKVEQRAKQLESSFLSAASSPVQSGATSPSGSQDSESINIPCEDGWEMSPRSVHWLEIRRLEEKIGRLAHIDEELLKKNKELEQQLKKMKISYSECQHENSALQEKLSEQLMQISALKSHIDEQKHRCHTPQKPHPFAEKIEDLQEKLEKQIENNKKLISDLQEAQATIRILQEEAHKNEEWIALLQKTVDNNTNQNTSEEEESLSTIEDLRNQLAEKIILVEATEKENEELQSEVDYLKTENTSLKSLLEKSEKEIETERAQVESLSEEMANIVENSKDRISDNENCNTDNLSEGKQDHESKLIDIQNRLKAKNLEILMLKATVTKLESSLRLSEKQLEYEKVLVETLQEELGSLTSYQKRLEQDFNTVQDMMQQKERELATLHEETEAQMKAEAEIETLQKKLADQKNIECELRMKIENLERQLSELMNLEKELKDKDQCIQAMTENHKKELNKLKKKISVLKNFKSVSENEADIQELVKNIMEASHAFGSDETNALQEVLIAMLRNFINLILNQMKCQHEEHIKSLNKSWQEKISEEIENKQKLFNSEMDSFNAEKEKLRTENDAFWQDKLKDIEAMLENEKEKCRKISESTESTKSELEAMYANEIATLRENLEEASKEIRSLEMTVAVLNTEIQRLREIENSQDNRFSLQYDSKLSAVSKTIQESFEKEKNKLLMELNSKLEQEKEMKLKHQKELSSVHQFFEARWANEMKKVQEYQAENLKKLKINSEKELEESLEKAKEEYIAKAAEERRQELQMHERELASLKANHDKELASLKANYERELASLKANHEKELASLRANHEKELASLKVNYEKGLALLKAKHEKEKRSFTDDKEKTVKEATDILEKKFKETTALLEKKFNENLEEIQRNLTSSNQSKMSEEQRKWEEEKLKLITTHRKQLSALKQELKDRYQRQFQVQSTAHNDEIKRLEETYNRKVEEMTDMIKEAKRCASKSGYSGSGSCRTTTPSSDVTSSDETCSSCQEDMLSANKHILVDKIHQDGKRVLSLVESTAQPYASVKEAHLWLEERKWIVNVLKSVAPATSNGNLKTVIMDLVDEIQKFRNHLEAVHEENSDLKKKCDDLEQQLSIQYSKLRDVSAQLRQQKTSNSELESSLAFKTSEVSDLKTHLLEAKRIAQLISENETSSHNHNSRRSSASSDEFGGWRAADNPKSPADRFSLFLPEIGNSPSIDQNISNNKASYIQDMPSIPQFDTPPLLSIRNDTPPDAIDNINNEVLHVDERPLTDYCLGKGINPIDVKLHGLWWVFKRSQSYNKSLIWQKRYLLKELKKFLRTERVTLAWLNYMNSDNDASFPSSEVTITEAPLPAISRFRAATFALIAVERLKSYVSRWRHKARIPSSLNISKEIQDVFHNYTFLSPATSPVAGGYQNSSQYLSAVPLSLADRGTESYQISSLLRSENKSKDTGTRDKSKLIEYVHRLEIIQKQLGLDSFR